MLGELSREQIEEVLRSEVVGRIGCHSDGRTYVVPITYAYADGAIYGHSAVGLKIRMMRQSPSVCFEVDHMDDMANWRSVIAWGRFEELRGEAAERGMRILLDRLRPLITSESSTPTHGTSHAADTAGHTAVLYRIALEEKTGRYEKR